MQKSSIGGSERPIGPRIDIDAKSVQCQRKKASKHRVNKLSEANVSENTQDKSLKKTPNVGPFSEQNKDDAISCRTTPKAIHENMGKPAHFQLNIDTNERTFDDEI